MNCDGMDSELEDIDKEPETWEDQLNNMFDGELDVIEVNDGKGVEGANLFKY